MGQTFKHMGDWDVSEGWGNSWMNWVWKMSWMLILHFNQTKVNVGASQVTQLVKNPPAMQETPVQFLGWEDPLEKG